MVRQEFRVNAMPNAVSILDHLRVGRAGLLSGFGLLEILPLYIADFGDNDDFFTPYVAGSNEFREHGPYKPFTVTVHVIG